LSGIVTFRGQFLVLDGAFIKRRVETSQIVTIFSNDASRGRVATAILLFSRELPKAVVSLPG